MIFVGGALGRAHSPCPSWSRHGPGSALPRRRGHSPAPRPAPRHYGRRPGRRNRSPAPRTTCRRSTKPRVYSSILPRRSGGCGPGIARASFCASRRGRQIFARRHQPRQRVAQRPDRRRDRHVIVVEDDDQPVAGVMGIVHRLIGHAGAHRAVADHRDRPARLAGQLVGDGEAERGGDAGRAVRRAERVIFALAAAW